jgi:signal transduction histidine kinase
LVLDAAVSCLPLETSQQVALRSDPAIGPIWADHDRLEQLFLNLIENAIRHTPAGTRVTVTAEPGRRRSPGKQEVVIRVTDNGPGIPPELAQRMFQPHERGSTTAPGAGLGLTIARGIVEAHRGQLTYKSTTAGACFEVTLSIDPQAERPAP